MKNIILINLFAVILIFLAGCGTTAPSKFYMLSSLPLSSGKLQVNNNQNRISIEIDLNEIPAYLNKPQMIVRINSNEIKLEEYHRWAETVKDSFPKIIANNLISLLSTEKFLVFAQNRIVFSDYQIIFNVNRFDGTPGKTVSLITQWVIFDHKKEKIILTQHSDINVKTEGDGFDKLAAAQSKALEILSRQISSAIEKLASN